MRCLLLAAVLVGLALPARAQDPLGGLSYSNNDIDFAWELSPSAPVAIRASSTLNATADPLVTEPVASCAASGNAKSVWWHVRSNSVSNATVAISLAGSTFDTVLSVYTYNGSAFAEVACNDDFGGTPQSRVSGLTLLTGFDYYVRVAGFGSGVTGSGAVAIALTSSASFEPSNHTWRPRSNFGSRFRAPGARLAYNVGALSAIATEPTAPASCSPNPGSNAIWYVYVPAQAGFLTLDTVGSDFDTILMVTDFNGNVLACNDDRPTSGESRIADLPVALGGDYLVRIASFNVAVAGTIRFNTSFSNVTAGEDGVPAAGVALRAPQPNPTTGRTAFTVALAAPGPARLAVVDALGREVAVLFDGPAAAGETVVSWDASALPAGVYAARLVAGGRVQTQRVTVVR